MAPPGGLKVGPRQCAVFQAARAACTQVNLRSVHRQKYACLYLASSENDLAFDQSWASGGSSQQQHDDEDSVRISSLIPWGWRSLFALEFLDGRYALRAADDRYLRRDGTLVAALGAGAPPPPDATFAVELRGCGAGLALRDGAGRYVTAVGRDAVVQGRNASAGKDELFAVEEGQPQVVIVAHNGKMVSIKQGRSHVHIPASSVSAEEILKSDDF